jgi:hypothetical protein
VRVRLSRAKPRPEISVEVGYAPEPGAREELAEVLYKLITARRQTTVVAVPAAERGA